MKQPNTSNNGELEKEKYRLSIIWNRLADKDVHGNIADILPLFHKVGIKEGRTQAISEFKEKLKEQIMVLPRHQLYQNERFHKLCIEVNKVNEIIEKTAQGEMTK